MLLLSATMAFRFFELSLLGIVVGMQSESGLQTREGMDSAVSEGLNTFLFFSAASMLCAMSMLCHMYDPFLGMSVIELLHLSRMLSLRTAQKWQ